MTARRRPWKPVSWPAVRQWWRERDALAKDGFLALTLTLPAFAPNLSQIGAQIGDLPLRPGDALASVLITAQAAPLVARRRWPAATLVVVASAFAAHQLLGYATTFASLGLYLALYSAGAHQPRSRPAPAARPVARPLLAAVTSTAYVLLAAGLHRLGSPQRLLDYLSFYLVLAAFWLVGSAVRRRREHEAERRLLAAELAITAERARIARELHDVVTHHVTAMVIQADAAQYLPAAAPERLGEALTAVSDTGRRALTDLRQLLGVLEATGERSPADPAPADRAPVHGRVADLVEQTRRVGQPVEFTEDGALRSAGAEAELAVYRVVQEALTNALKYAAGQPTRVLLRHGEEHTEIEVTTGAGGTGPAVGSGGRGLDGLRARIAVLDGRLEAGPRPGGGFRVRATIPLRPRQERP
ncbi:sensor histidine kinase [Kitasatospora sp. NPDC096147]|uniref:sensor histidine kinase n=1 Tax=Kitasatospora sp. NPDC096147 TaxID=3364093 RepID=UPI0037F9A6FC